jgi:hypothetical protein
VDRLLWRIERTDARIADIFIQPKLLSGNRIFPQ